MSNVTFCRNLAAYHFYAKETISAVLKFLKIVKYDNTR